MALWRNNVNTFLFTISKVFSCLVITLAWAVFMFKGKIT